jgi:hypothetical protein
MSTICSIRRHKQSTLVSRVHWGRIYCCVECFDRLEILAAARSLLNDVQQHIYDNTATPNMNSCEYHACVAQHRNARVSVGHPPAGAGRVIAVLHRVDGGAVHTPPYLLTSRVSTIGSAPGCHVVLAGAQPPTCSRLDPHHATIVYDTVCAALCSHPCDTRIHRQHIVSNCWCTAVAVCKSMAYTIRCM